MAAAVPLYCPPKTFWAGPSLNNLIKKKKEVIYILCMPWEKGFGALARSVGGEKEGKQKKRTGNGRKVRI